VVYPMALGRRRDNDLHVGKLGGNLRAARSKLGLSQEQVAERSGVHATEVSRIESGKRDPRASTIERLAKAVKVNPGELLE
jgi:transcriptional regulator with XRE-family HTH domain